jgi:hypothetical protein
MRAVSALLFVAAAGLITAGVVQIRHDYLLTGTELIGWALISLALFLGFTLPVRCKVIRTNRKACGKWAYGLLFGCTQVAGHWTGKFLYRLGMRRGEAKPVATPKPKGSHAMYQPASSQQKPVKVEVEESALAKCGFWIGVVSGIAGIIQAIISLVH